MKVAVRIRDYDQLAGALAPRRRQLGLRQLGACPSSGGIFGTNLIPFEA
jgi:hypothetical protein